MNLKQDIKDLNRLREILLVFIENGLGFVIDKTILKTHVPLFKRYKLKIQKKDSLPIRLRKSFEQLGPAFIKLGQILSLRPDLIPMEYVKEFEKLLDNVPAFSYDEVKKIVESEFGRKINEVFKEFEKKPIASASISQVHKAKLKNNKIVAVKVRRPNVVEIFNRDVQVMKHVAEIIDKHFKKQVSITRVVDEFERWTKRELNFNIEAMNAIRFRKNNKNSKYVYIPEVYPDYSTEKILTLEFLDGVDMAHFDIIKKKKNLNKILLNGFYAILTQVFEQGFFHADPHPGNFIVLKDGKIGFVDFGITGEFDNKLRKKSMDLFTGIVENDIDKVVETLVSMSYNTDIDKIGFRNEVRDIILPMQYASLKDIKVSLVLEKVLDIALEYKIHLPIDFVLFGKTIATIEGLALRYNPDFKLVEHAKPFVKGLLRKQVNMSNIYKNVKKNVLKYEDFIEDMPEAAKQIIDRIKTGKVNVDIENEDVKSLTNEIQRSSGNVALGVIIAALIIGSALVTRTGLNEYIALTGFIVAMVLGIWLIKQTIFYKG